MAFVLCYEPTQDYVGACSPWMLSARVCYVRWDIMTSLQCPNASLCLSGTRTSSKTPLRTRREAAGRAEMSPGKTFTPCLCTLWATVKS